MKIFSCLNFLLKKNKKKTERLKNVRWDICHFLQHEAGQFFQKLFKFDISSNLEQPLTAEDALQFCSLCSPQNLPPHPCCAKISILEQQTQRKRAFFLRIPALTGKDSLKSKAWSCRNATLENPWIFEEQSEVTAGRLQKSPGEWNRLWQQQLCKWGDGKEKILEFLRNSWRWQQEGFRKIQGNGAGCGNKSSASGCCEKQSSFSWWILRNRFNNNKKWVN